MISLANLVNQFTTLSQNTSAANQNLGLFLMSQQARYLVQKYFDNERTFQTSTIGGQSLTLNSAPLSGATSATLSSAWTNPTSQQQVSFSNSNARTALFTLNSTTITWTVGLTSDCTTAITTAGVQEYAIPANISKITSTFIQVGQLRFVPVAIQTRMEYDRINFLPYSSDIVNYAYIYNGKLCFWPIPSTTSNIIQFNYKARIPDFSSAFIFNDASGTAFTAGTSPVFDYQKGTLSGITAGSTSISGTGTAWNTTGKYPLNTDVTYQNLYLNISAPSGEGIWYPISQFTSDTALTLALPIINAPSATTVAGGYSIGQMPVLQDDFHDMILYGALMTYYTSIVSDQQRFQQFQNMYNSRLSLLGEYAGTKQVNVDLEETPVLTNPNLYPFAQP